METSAPPGSWIVTAPRLPIHLVNGFHNFRVCATSADIAAHSFADFIVREFRALLRRFTQQASRRTDLTGSAVATLKAIAFDEGSLKRMQLIPHRKSFDGGDGLAIVRQPQRQTAVNPPAIYQHRAGATLAVVTSFLRTGKPDSLAQEIEQCHSRIHRE